MPFTEVARLLAWLDVVSAITAYPDPFGLALCGSLAAILPSCVRRKIAPAYPQVPSGWLLSVGVRDKAPPVCYPLAPNLI